MNLKCSFAEIIKSFPCDSGGAYRDRPQITKLLRSYPKGILQIAWVFVIFATFDNLLIEYMKYSSCEKKGSCHPRIVGDYSAETDIIATLKFDPFLRRQDLWKMCGFVDHKYENTKT
jgi:hypothetical protein